MALFYETANISSSVLKLATALHVGCPYVIGCGGVTPVPVSLGPNFLIAHAELTNTLHNKYVVNSAIRYLQLYFSFANSKVGSRKVRPFHSLRLIELTPSERWAVAVCLWEAPISIAGCGLRVEIRHSNALYKNVRTIVAASMLRKRFITLPPLLSSCVQISLYTFRTLDSDSLSCGTLWEYFQCFQLTCQWIDGHKFTECSLDTGMWFLLPQVLSSLNIHSLNGSLHHAPDSLGDISQFHHDVSKNRCHQRLIRSNSPRNCAQPSAKNSFADFPPAGHRTAQRRFRPSAKSAQVDHCVCASKV